MKTNAKANANANRKRYVQANRERGGPVTLSRSREKLVGRLRSRRTRSREGMVLVEGPRTAADVLDAGTEIRFALVTEAFEASPAGRALVRRLRGGEVPVEGVEEEELEGLSDTESPQGILLVCKEPEHGLDELLGRPRGRFLVLDGVQDPGNLGTLVRAARAFALDGVVALDGTVDPWNPKAVRAAAGASFHLPVVKADWSRVEPLLGRGAIRLLVADAEGSDVAGVSSQPPWALVIGSEAEGPRREVEAAGDAVVTVPMPGGTESLNAGVAGAVLLYVLARPEAGRDAAAPAAAHPDTRTGA